MALCSTEAAPPTCHSPDLTLRTVEEQLACEERQMTLVDPRRNPDDGCWVSFDPNDSTWTLCTTPIGPAGPAVLELGRAGTLSVDWADCFRFTSLLITHDPGGFASSPTAVVVARLLGLRARERMLSVSDKAFLAELDDDGIGRCRSLCLLSLLEEVRRDGGASAMEPSLWAADAAILRDESRIPGVQELAALEAERGARALAQLDPGRLGPRARRRCREVAEKLIPLVAYDSTIAALKEQMRAGFEEAGDFPDPDPVPEDAGDVDLPGWVGGFGVDPRRGARLEWASNSSELTVRVSTRPGAEVPREVLWARAFAPDDGTLLGVALFVTEEPGVSAAAHLRLRAGHRGEDVFVDVTDDAARAAAPGLQGMLARATDIGRHAAEADRMGQAEKALRLWTHCAGAWDAVDDPDRAALALRYAGDVPAAADALRRKITEHARRRADAGTWVETYLGSPREIPPAFLAELVDARA